jgi:hypothetical protein
LSHFVIVPSETDTPICGMTTSMASVVAISAPSGDGLAFPATARGRQARTQEGPILVRIGPTEEAAWRRRAPSEVH